MQHEKSNRRCPTQTGLQQLPWYTRSTTPTTVKSSDGCCILRKKTPMVDAYSRSYVWVIPISVHSLIDLHKYDTYTDGSGQNQTRWLVTASNPTPLRIYTVSSLEHAPLAYHRPILIDGRDPWPTSYTAVWIRSSRVSVSMMANTYLHSPCPACNRQMLIHTGCLGDAISSSVNA